MKKEVAKLGILAVSGLMVAGGAGAIVAPAVAAAQPNDLVQAAQQVENEEGSGAKAKAVQGVFSYDQNRLSGNEQIRKGFVKAVNALCDPSIDRMQSGEVRPIEVYVDMVCTMCGLVSEMTTRDGSGSYIIGCSCASNPAGGSATVNAEVEGVSLEEVMDQAGVTAL